MVFIFRCQYFDIQRFSVQWERSAYDDMVEMHVNRWSLNAVKYNVQEIIIVIGQLHDSAYEIPHRILNCKSLRKLEMRVWGNARKADIILPSSMSLPQLNELTFIGLSISNVESSKRLFSSCPVLERLWIGDCDIKTDDQRKLIVDSPSLKMFVYTDHCRRLLPQNDTMDNINIKLCAPNLKIFSFRSLLMQDYSLEISSPLFGVYFDMALEDKDENENAEAYSRLSSAEKKVYAKHMLKFLGAIYMVKALRLSAGFLEVLSQAPDLLDSQPSRLCNNLQHLVLDMWSTRGCLRAIAYLLKICPRVTRLFVKSKESNSADVGDYWEAGLLCPGMLSHLGYVRFEEVEGCDAEIKLLSFLLENAKVLKKVVLYFRSSAGSPRRARQVEQFERKLRAVPAASSSIQLVFKT
ncbi:hypothetical protein MKW98_020790 [Papaver atlanticum]|uniref:FBD domain-containing protein n=1 Tax=Papaver atlanticum TaxID=357466 RepID=A0AAD4XY44_9MAGN|nr:hypothetical protein MKW98_020790 [Papaver atlanticum]